MIAWHNSVACSAASGEVKVIMKPLDTEQLNGVGFPGSSDSDTSSESDVAEITDISEMREIISRMDDDDDGDHDKYVPFSQFRCPFQQLAYQATNQQRPG